MKSAHPHLIERVLFTGIMCLLLCACVPGFSSPSPFTVATSAPSARTRAVALVPSTPFPLDGPSASASTKGITVSMRVKPKVPYFLSELIAVELELANYTRGEVRLAEGCGGVSFLVELTGGGPPTYDLPTVKLLALRHRIVLICRHRMISFTFNGLFSLLAHNVGDDLA